MQEEVENRTVNLAITTTRLSVKLYTYNFMYYLIHYKLIQKDPKVVYGKLY